MVTNLVEFESTYINFNLLKQLQSAKLGIMFSRSRCVMISGDSSPKLGRIQDDHSQCGNLSILLKTSIFCVFPVYYSGDPL